MEEIQRELTYGEKAVGLNFNPSNDPTVNRIKKLYAEIIDLCHTGVVPLPDGEHSMKDVDRHREHERLFKIAIMEAQTAQMWAVKAITFKYDHK